MEANKIMQIAANALNAKKARELKAIEISDLTVLSEYFVIATATSSTMCILLRMRLRQSLKRQGKLRTILRAGPPAG